MYSKGHRFLSKVKFQTWLNRPPTVPVTTSTASTRDIANIDSMSALDGARHKRMGSMKMSGVASATNTALEWA